MTDDATPAGAPLWLRLLLPVLAFAVLLLGAWLAVTRLAPTDRWGQILTGTVAFVAIALVLGRLVKHRPALRLPMRLGVIAAAVLAVGGLYWTSFRDQVVNEDVAVAAARAPDGPSDSQAPPAPDPAPAPRATPEPAPAPPPPPRNVELGRGAFSGLDGHGARGTATAIRLAEGGRVVTFTDFDVDNGPGVKVYLAPSEAYGEDVIFLGDLKGNVGNQQYAIPDGVDLARYGTVLLWCEPFSVRMAAASFA